MKKTTELKQAVEAQRKKVQELEAAEKFEDAAKEARGLNDLIDQYTIAQALERSEFEAFVNAATPAAKAETVDAEKVTRRALNRLTFGAVMKYGAPTEQEKSAMDAIKDRTAFYDQVGQQGAVLEKGGYLLPEAQESQITEFRRTRQPLKGFTRVVSVNARTGTIPTASEEKGVLTNFSEFEEIKKSDLDFGQIKYDIKDYGDIIPIARQLIQDIDVDIVGFIGQRFAKKAVNTENAQIVAALNKINKTDLKDVAGIRTALNVTLDPAISAGATIFTNQSGFDYLDRLVDKQGRPLLTASLADGTRKLFAGRPVQVLRDDLLALDGKKLPFLIGSMADYLTFFDKKGIEVALSEEAGFTSYQILLRAVERFGLTVMDAASMVYGQIDPSTAPKEV